MFFVSVSYSWRFLLLILYKKGPHFSLIFGKSNWLWKMMLLLARAAGDYFHGLIGKTMNGFDSFYDVKNVMKRFRGSSEAWLWLLHYYIIPGVGNRIIALIVDTLTCLLQAKQLGWTALVSCGVMVLLLLPKLLHLFSFTGILHGHYLHLNRMDSLLGIHDFINKVQLMTSVWMRKLTLCSHFSKVVNSLGETLWLFPGIICGPLLFTWIFVSGELDKALHFESLHVLGFQVLTLYALRRHISRYCFDWFK